MSPTETVLGFFNAMVSRDFDAALTFIGEDIVYDNKPLATLRGKHKFEQLLRPWVDDHDEIAIDLRNVVADGEVVIVERVDRDRDRDRPWVSTQAAGFFRVHGGEIVEWRDYYDLNGFCLQSGRNYGDLVERVAALAAS